MHSEGSCLHHQSRPNLPLPALATFPLARGRNRSYQPVNLDRIRTDNETSGSPLNSARRSSIGARSRSRSTTPTEDATKANTQVWIRGLNSFFLGVPTTLRGRSHAGHPCRFYFQV